MPQTNPNAEKARQFAIKAHKEQRYGSHPYVYHLDSVAEIASAFGETAKALAYLHDVIEDTDITEEQLKAQFGNFVTECTLLVTDCDGENRKERKQRTNAKLKAIPKDQPQALALIVKTADRLANMRSCVEQGNVRLLEMYLKEYQAFREAVWREGLANSLWEELDQIEQN